MGDKFTSWELQSGSSRKAFALTCTTKKPSHILRYFGTLYISVLAEELQLTASIREVLISALPSCDVDDRLESGILSKTLLIAAGVLYIVEAMRDSTGGIYSERFRPVQTVTSQKNRSRNT